MFPASISFRRVGRRLRALAGLVPVAVALMLTLPDHAPDSAGIMGGERRSHLVPATAAEILSHVEGRSATVHVLNFWATWCAPCIEEFPDFVALAGEFESSDVVVDFVSVDFLEDSVSVSAFLDRMGWHRSSFLKVGKDHEFVSAFQTGWTGAVPATMIFEHGRMSSYIAGKTNFETLTARIDESLAVH